MRRTCIALAVCVALLIALPFVITNEFYVNMASQILIYALLAVSLNIMLGYGGMTSLGHAAYLGITAYACVIVIGAGLPAAALGALAWRKRIHNCRKPGTSPCGMNTTTITKTAPSNEFQRST